MSESKNDKFQRLGTARADRVITIIASMRNLMSPTYDSSADERELLVLLISNAVDELATSFNVVITPDTIEEEPIVEIPTTDDDYVITRAEGVALIRTGPMIGKAINAIQDNNPELAEQLLLDVLAA